MSANPPAYEAVMGMGCARSPEGTFAPDSIHGDPMQSC